MTNNCITAKCKRCLDDRYKYHIAACDLIEKSYQLDDPKKRKKLIDRRNKLYDKVSIVLNRVDELASHIISQRMKEEYGVSLDTLYNSYYRNGLLMLEYTVQEKTKYKSSLRDVTIIAIDCEMEHKFSR